MYYSTNDRAVWLSLSFFPVCAIKEFSSVHSCYFWRFVIMDVDEGGFAFVCPLLSGVLIRLFSITLVVHTSALMREPVK